MAPLPDADPAVRPFVGILWPLVLAQKRLIDDTEEEEAKIQMKRDGAAAATALKDKRHDTPAAHSAAHASASASKHHLRQRRDAAEQHDQQQQQQQREVLCPLISHSTRTELTCTKLTQLHDALLVARVSVTKLIDARDRPITRRVTGSTWCWSVQFVCCEHGLTPTSHRPPDTTRQCCLCRVWRGGVNGIPDNSRLSPREKFEV